MVDNTEKISIDGSQYSLLSQFTLWYHDIHNKDWSIKSYRKICNIITIADFWKLFNNFDRLNYKFKHFFLMKKNVQPIWEHETNRNGGICSFRIELKVALKLWELIAIYMVCGQLTNNYDDINGISFSPKNHWVIIKIWNKDSKNDISKFINEAIFNKFPNLSVKYRSNQPEY